MNKFCIDLNLDIPVLIDPIDEDQIKNIGSKIVHKKVSVDTINPELIKLFTSKGLLLTFVESFHLSKNSYLPIHEDGYNYTDVLKMNWVFGGKDSTMNWYEPTKEPVWKKTVIGVDYKSYDTDNVRLIHSQVVGRPSLVQVGIPHNSTTVDERLCISIVPLHIDDGSFVTFQQGIDLFTDYIK